MLKSWFVLTLVVASLASCVTDESQPGPVDEAGGGKADASSDTFRFSGRFRLFKGIDSQEGLLRGGFEMARPVAPQIETQVLNVTYSLALDADSYHSSYTLTSDPMGTNHSYANWRTEGLELIIEQVSPLSAGAERSVFDARTGNVMFKFYPYCTGEVLNCAPGALSGFDYAGSPSSPYPTMQLELLGGFTLGR